MREGPLRAPMSHIGLLWGGGKHKNPQILEIKTHKAIHLQYI